MSTSVPTYNIDGETLLALYLDGWAAGTASILASGGVALERAEAKALDGVRQILERPEAMELVHAVIRQRLNGIHMPAVALDMQTGQILPSEPE